MRRRHQLHVAAALLLLASCSGAAPTIPDDESAFCADVGDLRACWGCAGGGDCLMTRWTPPTRPELGWRCAGGGGGRTCRDRALGGGPFQCTPAGNDCSQRHPRMPDDAEWECIDMNGVVICRGGEPASAVVLGAPDEGWICGARPKGGPRGPERVCVDLAPDLPRGDVDGWVCRYDHQRGEKRICKQQAGPRVGGPCAAGCPEGTRCVEEHCLPAKPAPGCWFDDECEGGAKCRYGTCSS